MGSSTLLRALPVLCVLALAGCATERVVLLPESDGRPSALVIQPRQGAEVVIDKPYTAATISANRVDTTVADAETVQKRYREVMEALPQRARSYTLHFVFGKTQFTEESKSLLDQMLSDLQQIPVPELAIIGHADDVGPDSVNDKLSLDRANMVLKLIRAKGIELHHVTVAGRGKREPLFVSPTGRPEPRNRRVELRIK